MKNRRRLGGHGRRKGEDHRRRGLHFEALEPRLVLDSTVVFNEIMYHPATDPLVEGDYEWVELFNQMAIKMDISGWSLQGGINYTFPQGTVIPGRGYKVIASNPDELEDAGIFSGALGPFNDRLANSGEDIRLLNNSGRLMNEVNYGDSGAWPAGPDGSGFSLAKLDAYTSSGEAENWTISRQLNGTPGAANYPSGPDPGPGVVFNEIAPAGGGFWLEITNQGASNYALGGASITTSAAAGSTYVFPTQNLTPGQCLQLTQAQLGFGGADADKLYFYSAGKNRLLDTRAVDTHLRGLAPGRGNAWLYPNAATPGAANSFNFHDEIVINEVMYHGMPQQAATTYETTNLLAIDAATQWRYNQKGDSLPANWATTQHPVDNSHWYSGAGLLAYETGSLPFPIRTTLNDPLSVYPFVVTTYFETEFTFSGNLNDVDQLKLSHLTDDGAVFYLNGVEVLRYNLGAGAVNSGTLATAAIEATYLGPISIPKTNLQQGVNRLSVEVHQVNTVSTDIVFGAELVTTTVPVNTPFQESNEEWIELYNRGASPVDMSGWSFTKAVNYDFPAGTVIPAGGYLVVAKHAAELQAKYPSISIVGDFDQSLSNSNNDIVLKASDKNPADEVHYYDGGYWPVLADGGGSSMELRNPNADNSKPEAWAPSNERNAGTWNTYNLTTTASADTGPIQWNELLFGMLDSGEVLIDDVSVIRNPGTGSAFQMIQNGSFQSDTIGALPLKWRLVGNHSGKVVADPDNPNNKVLDMVATGVTTHEENNTGTTFVGNTAIVNGTIYQISFKARWVGGSSLLNARFDLAREGQTFILEVPENTGTPGAQNSTFVANAGPTYSGFKHSPVLPSTNQSVTVSVTAQDPDGVASMTLKYSVAGGSWITVAMSLANGVYSGTIPGQSTAGTVVQFYVLGQDTLGATSTYPAAGANSRALYQVNDGKGPATAIDAIRIILLPADNTYLFASTNLMSNQDLGGTVIYNNKEVFYDVGVRLKGSAASRGNASWGGSYSITFQPNHLFRGVIDQLAIDSSGNDSTPNYQSQVQILVDQILNHGGGSLASNYDDLGYVIVQKPEFVGTATLQLARYSNDYLNESFVNGSNGSLFEYELIYYQSLTVDGNPESLKIASSGSHIQTPTRLESFYNLVGTDKDKYRWNFLLKNNKAEDDFSSIIAMTTAFRLSGASFLSAIAPLIDVDQWLRTFAVANLMGLTDTFAASGITPHDWPHNIMFYVRPDDGKVLMFPWDWDETFDYNTTAPIVPNSSTLNYTTQPLYKLVNGSPEYAHDYYGHLYDLINTTYNSTYMSTSWVNSFAALVGQDYSATASYIASPSASVLSQLNTAVPSVSFAITTNGGNNFTVGTPTTTLAGNGWIDVREIRLAGGSQPLPIAWTTKSAWQITVPLSPGANNLTLNAYDFQGNLVASDTIAITSTSAVPQPRDWLRITEIMYHPSDPPPGGSFDREEFEFIELQNIGAQPLALGGVQFTAGVTFTFPAMTLQPGACTVVVENPAAFASRYPGSIDVAGQYIDKLNNAGETLTLLDATGFSIQSFTYLDDDWYPSTDGPGYSLVIVDPAGPLSAWGTQAGWRPSSYMQGSPGAVDPVPGFTVLPTSGLTTTESGDSTQFSVALNSKPLDNVTIAIATSNFLEGTPNTYSLTFTPDDWNQSQPVTVTGVSDWIADGDVAYTILLLPAVSADPAYNDMNPADVSLTNLDKTRVWDGGGTNDLWMNPINWANNVAPLPGDLLLFPAAAARLTNNNNYDSGKFFQSIVFMGNGYQLQGNAVQLSAGIYDASTAGTQDNRVALSSITLTAPQTIQNLHLAGNLIIQSPLLLGDNLLTIDAAGGTRLEGIVSGSAGITKTGDGLLTMTAANTYGGDTTVTAGQLAAQQIEPNGQPAMKVEVRENGQLVAASIVVHTLTIGEPPTAAAFAANAASPFAATVPQLSSGELPATTAAAGAATDSIRPAVGQTISTLAIVSAARLPEQPASRQWAFDAATLTAASLEKGRLRAFSSPSKMAERPKDSAYAELPDLARAKKPLSAALTGSQLARNLALQSLVKEFRQSFATEQEDSELLAGKHFRKWHKLARQAVDEFHS